MVKALARSLGAEFRRIQFTPDILPSDVTLTFWVTGAEIFQSDLSPKSLSEVLRFLAIANWRSQAYNIHDNNSWTNSRSTYRSFKQPPIVFGPANDPSSPRFGTSTNPHPSGKNEEFQVRLIKPMANRFGLLLPTESLVLHEISDDPLRKCVCLGFGDQLAKI